MQAKIYSRATLELLDYTYVRDYNIDDDYLINNNSKIYAVKKINASSGDIIVLIKNSGAYHKGVITAIDNVNMEISYKDTKEFFNNKIISPFRKIEAGVTYDSIDFIKKIIIATYADGDYLTYNEGTFEKTGSLHNGDIIIAKGNIDVDTISTYESCYTDNDLSLNLKEYLIDVFEKNNIVIQFNIDFDFSKSPKMATIIYENNQIELIEVPTQRIPRLVYKVRNISTTRIVIKDNIIAASFDFEEQQIPQSTVAYILKDGYLAKTYYLLDDETISDSFSEGRFTIYPSKPIILDFKYNDKEDLTEEQQMYSLASSNLTTGDYYHCIELEISSQSKMIDYNLLQFGTAVRIINNQGIINSIFTGKKESKKDSITLIFGKSRRLYTDKVILNLRRKKDK